MLMSLSLGLWIGWLTARLAPETPMGRACQDWLVERPAGWVTSLTPRKVASLVISAAVMTVFVIYLAPMISGEAALLLAGDMLAYAEVFCAVAIVAIRSGRASSMVRLKVKAVTSSALGVCRRAARYRRQTASGRRPRRPAPKEDPEPAAFVLA